MDVTVLYNVPHEVHWRVYIPLYFYFTGLSAGSFILSSLSTVFGMKKYKVLAMPSAITAFALLLLAPIFLIMDLAQPFRFWHTLVPLYFNPTAPVSWGVWLLTIYPIMTLIYIWFIYIGDERTTRTLGIIIVPLAVAVHAYTGFVFGVTKARPWWNSALMPGYFLTSALLSGIALLLIIVLIQNKVMRREHDRDLLDGLGKMMLAIIVIDMFWVVSFWLVLGLSVEDGIAALTVAFNDPEYIWGELLMGMGIPFILLVYRKTRTHPLFVTINSALIMMGVFFMRYTLVFTAFKIPLS